MEFKPINTQEELDAIIKERVDRANEAAKKKYGDYDDIKKERDDLLTEKAGFAQSLDDQKKAAEKLQQDLDSEKKKSAGYELNDIRTRVAIKTKLPLELRDRLKGSTEKEIEADAADLAKLIGASGRKAQPLRDPEGTDASESARTAARLETLRNIRGE